VEGDIENTEVSHKLVMIGGSMKGLSEKSERKRGIRLRKNTKGKRLGGEKDGVQIKNNELEGDHGGKNGDLR